MNNSLLLAWWQVILCLLLCVSPLTAKDSWRPLVLTNKKKNAVVPVVTMRGGDKGRWLPTGLDVTTTRNRSTIRISRPINIAHELVDIRGGSSAPPNSSAGNMMAPWQSALADIFRERIQPALQNPEKHILQPARALLKQATREAKQFVPESGSTDATDTSHHSQTTTLILDPVRVVRLVLVSLLLSHVMSSTTTDFLKETLNSLSFKWKKPAEQVLQDCVDNVHSWWGRARRDGGLFKQSTWTNAHQLSRAWQTQVSPQYQSAAGLAVGMIFSPAAWSVVTGMMTVGTGVYVASELHHTLKQEWDEYWQSLSNIANQAQSEGGWNDDFVMTVDAVLEDWRHTVRHWIQYPETIYTALRDELRQDLGQRWANDSVVPPHMQRGLLLGAVVGLLVGV
jgi:hypothetical protein